MITSAPHITSLHLSQLSAFLSSTLHLSRNPLKLPRLGIASIDLEALYAETLRLARSIVLGLNELPRLTSIVEISISVKHRITHLAEKNSLIGSNSPCCVRTFVGWRIFGHHCNPDGSKFWIRLDSKLKRSFMFMISWTKRLCNGQLDGFTNPPTNKHPSYVQSTKAVDDVQRLEMGWDYC